MWERLVCTFRLAMAARCRREPIWRVRGSYRRPAGGAAWAGGSVAAWMSQLGGSAPSCDCLVALLVHVDPAVTELVTPFEVIALMPQSLAGDEDAGWSGGLDGSWRVVKDAGAGRPDQDDRPGAQRAPRLREFDELRLGDWLFQVVQPGGQRECLRLCERENIGEAGTPDHDQ